jgi:hypothetical protein
MDDILPAGQPPVSAPAEYGYDAFISYRPKDGATLAGWLRRRLQHFRVPKEVYETLSAEKRALHDRRPRIWLDTAYEKSSDDFLIDKIFPALDGSARLIVVSSPSAFDPLGSGAGTERPNWLEREIDRFVGSSVPGQTARPIDVAIAPGAPEHRFPGRLAEHDRWDWIDFRGFRPWRGPLQRASL